MKRSTRLLTMLHFLPTGAFLRLAYLNETGHILRLKNPRRFNEKLNALKLRSAAPTWSRYVDKLEARKHVRRVIGEDHLVPLIAQYDSVEEIDWSALPQKLESPQGIPSRPTADRDGRIGDSSAAPRFVVKCTHGSHCGLICMDKRLFDQQAKSV